MTMEEYRQSLANMMQQECQKAKEVNANHEVTEQNEVSSEYELAMDLQKHFPDYTVSVTPTQVENINAAFQNGKQFGHQVGFIDTGLLIFKNKGKNGIAFYTSGISERSVSERTDSTISYNMICQSIIRNGQNLLAENKFTLQQGMLTEIVVSNKMLEVLQTVRTSLLEKTELHVLCTTASTDR